MEINGFKKIIDKKEIEEKIIELADEINDTYKDRQLLLIGVLKGSFIFLADLIRELDLKTEVDFVELSSYGSEKESSGKINMVKGLSIEIKGKDVLIVEDIIDTGNTMAFLLDFLKSKNPKSVRICALTDKPSRREVEVPIDFLGFIVPNKFIVGYGIDYDQKYRNLKSIFYVED
ncbi:MAG: hypoxanthine phosphoribosyltransferase [Candidatus Lokiarchaeota archaeon]|nr:hypoxanthine phosphoribosyltransferase [Candidatus Lokiarchaeota archaeon]